MLICVVGPMAETRGVLFCMVGGPMVVDGEDTSATVIAVVACCLLINPCPRLCRGNPYHGGGYGSRSC